LYRASSVIEAAQAKYTLAGKTTRVALDTNESLDLFRNHYRETMVFGQSELLEIADAPITTPVTGATIDLAQPATDLVEGQWLVASGTDSATGESISELVQISAINGAKLTVTPALKKSYVRLGSKPEESFSLNANVARATHGETVSEIVGSGDGSTANQNFKLKQAPALTYTHSTAPGGMKSSLQIRVNDLLWHEVSTLFGRQSRERVFTTDMADDGSVTVRFGDGVRGARLPSGAQNLKATYRRGSGLDGLVRAGQLTSLLTRPPGLKSVINPFAAEGADEPESFANAQQNAPLTVLTLERVVSLEDYENFSRSYAGIAKALATWTWDGRTRGVFLTVAAPLGAPVSNLLIADLITAIHAAGDPFVPVRAVSYQKRLFKVAGKIKVDPDYEAEKVLAEANDTLRDTFSFAKRQFGQSVNLSEVIALVQVVDGVVAVDIDSLYRTGEAVKLNSRLEAELPHGGDPASLGAAELLTLDPAPIDLEEMP
jgi:predicted phage baseplate assembly protein